MQIEEILKNDLLKQYYNQGNEFLTKYERLYWRCFGEDIVNEDYVKPEEWEDVEAILNEMEKTAFTWYRQNEQKNQKQLKKVQKALIEWYRYKHRKTSGIYSIIPLNTLHNYMRSFTDDIKDYNSQLKLYNLQQEALKHQYKNKVN